jgi:hypothetical protein
VVTAPITTRRFANKKLAGVIAVASMAVAGLVVFPPPAGAITGCPSGTVSHCYAIGRMGENWTGQFAPINGISGDLVVNCLGVDQYTDFVNYETWLDTNLNADPVGTYWVEEGAKFGIGVTGADEGFQWFWADNRPGGGYWEHYEGGAALNQFTNVSFDWVSGTGKWDVYLGGSYKGESVNNGAWAEALPACAALPSGRLPEPREARGMLHKCQATWANPGLRGRAMAAQA